MHIAVFPSASSRIRHAESKGFLADDGKKAQEKEAEYVAALTEVAKTQSVFLDAIAKRDEINTRTAFEKAPKDTIEYYRAGLTMAMNSFLSSGRNAIAHAAHGDYKPSRITYMGPIQMDAQSFTQDFNNLINGLNARRHVQANRLGTRQPVCVADMINAA